MSDPEVIFHLVSSSNCVLYSTKLVNKVQLLICIAVINVNIVFNQLYGSMEL